MGNRQRLNVALALIGAPHVLLLDEPTASLDPGHRRRLWEVVAGVRDEGGAVVFSTQNLEEVERHADRVVAPEGRRRGRRGRGLGVVRNVRLLLGKDLRVLRRSPLLLGVLVAYPLLIAALVVLVAQYANAKPRVAFVDEDGLPEQVEIGGQTFHVDRTIDRVAREVTLVRLPRRRRSGSSRRGASSPS